MDFRLSEEHEAVRRTVRAFVDREVVPHIRRWDEAGRLGPEVLPRLRELGLLGTPIPEVYGGSGLDYISFGIVCEELERGDTALRTLVSVHSGLVSLTLLQWGSEEQKKRYLVPLARGERLGAFGLTETDAGSDVAAMRTAARRVDGGYVLSGAKMWISLANTADVFLIFAYTDPEKRHRGITAFIVERAFPGVTTRPITGKLGIRAGDTGEIILEDVFVPEANVLGEEGEGFKIAMSALDNGRYSVAAGATGIIAASLEASIAYAKERRTFGVPIAEHQLIKQKIARMAAMLDIARLLVYRVGWMKNEGLRATRETSLAKWIAADYAFDAANEALQIHGAYGYVHDFPVERYLRNARVLSIYEGTREIHTLLQADYALGYRVDKPLRRTLPGWPYSEA
ncbi:MAG: acyl-CoA dehydrogenase family protein [Hydrogenibacillus schlegelii]|uniref:Acyl-CoA dehydrogenase n=1 Tax=Hydrogenibacillus schlegelii TaxID=1484 RepID=A0A947CWJ0_HYDSH|nr:acyl-CoA dehydrogenase family protein [Hydrogenibacillus schlegelii]